MLRRPKKSDPLKELRELARFGAWGSLWWHILRSPFPQAVQAARYLKPRKWMPTGEADAQLAHLLVNADHRVVDRVAETVLAAVTHRTHKWMTAMPDAAGFSHREPVVAFSAHHKHDLSVEEIVTADRGGVREVLYQGSASHWSVACIDSERVVARREFGGGMRGDTEVVLYTPGSENVLMNGGGLLDARVEATANGFVVGLKMIPVAFAEADGRQEEIDLSKYGIRVGCDFAVDSTGGRIAFAYENQILVTDSRLQPLHHVSAAKFPSDKRGASAIGFLGDSIVTAEWEDTLKRWKIIGGRIREINGFFGSTPRTLFRFAPVAPWNLLIGEAGNENFFFDAMSLDRTVAPWFLGKTERVVGRFVSAPYGRLAVSEGLLFPAFRVDTSATMSTVLYDLQHPLNLLAKPLVSLTSADAEALRSELDLPEEASPYDLSQEAREVLGLVGRAAALSPSLTSA